MEQDSHLRTKRRMQWSQLRRLARFIRPYRRHLAVAFIGVVVSAALGLVFPRIMGNLVDTALDATGTTDRLNQIALLLLVVFAVQGVFNYLRIYALAAAGQGVVADIRRAVYDRIVRLPVPFFDGRRTGEVTARLTSDAAVVQSTASAALAQILYQTITLVGGVTLIILLSPLLSLTVLIFVPLVIGIAVFFGRRLNRLSRRFQDQLATANAFAEESIRSIRVVKWFTAEQAASNRYDRDIAGTYRIALRRARMRALLVPFVTFVGFGTLALVLWAGGRLVLEGTLRPGELVSFLLYTLVVAGAISSMAGLYSQVQEALGASERIFGLLDEPVERPDTDDVERPDARQGSIAFQKVSFTYPGRDIRVLTDIELAIDPGEKVALVGPSGGGKSTLTQLIARFYDPTEGTVIVDGVDVRRQDLTVLRSTMAAVPQETQLFSGSIAENLRLARPDASDDRLIQAAITANAHDFVTAFPDGYDTTVGERGVKLSGGQRQRIAIARAVLADPRILILDEATSSLDAESEGLVQEALERLMVGRTTLIVAHRLSTVKAADRLLVVADGRIVEQGSHAELLAAGGLYAQLASKQLLANDAG